MECGYCISCDSYSDSGDGWRGGISIEYLQAFPSLAWMYCPGCLADALQEGVTMCDNCYLPTDNGTCTYEQDHVLKAAMVEA